MSVTFYISCIYWSGKESVNRAQIIKKIFVPNEKIAGRVFGPLFVRGGYFVSMRGQLNCGDMVLVCTYDGYTIYYFYISENKSLRLFIFLI